MKRLLFLTLFLFVSFSIWAQSDFTVKKSSRGFYIEHQVMAKESFFSIGRNYNIHHQTIAKFNGLQTSKGLSKGQVLRIPLNDSNFDQKSGKGVPVYHINSSNPTPREITEAFNVGSTELYKWNTMNAISTSGAKIIVGFLITKEMPSLVVDLSSNTLPSQPPITRTEDKPKETEAVVPKKEEKKADVISVSNDNRTGNGFFKGDFERQIRKFPLSTEQMVTSGVFKTTSGWQDAKYYLLIDKVEPGTIVKITNPINNKSVYAKVLYGMDGIRQNEGLDIRISNSAAAALDITDTDKFFVKVNY